MAICDCTLIIWLKTHAGFSHTARRGYVWLQVGDGIADDSAAFLRAIATMTTGALYIPSGK